MGILIKGMKMPEKMTVFVVFPNGYTAVYDASDTFIGEAKAVPVPPHGRLGDFDEFLNRAFGTGLFNEDDMRLLQGLVGDSSIVIQAEEGADD